MFMGSLPSDASRFKKKTRPVPEFPKLRWQPDLRSTPGAPGAGRAAKIMQLPAEAAHNLLHLEASYILSEFLGGPLRVPLAADVVVTGDRVLIYAEYDGTIDLDLPWGGDGEVMRYDPTGSEIQNEVVSLGGRYVASLSRGEFVFLRDANGTAVPALSTWRFVVMTLLVLTGGTVVLRRRYGVLQSPALR